MVHRRLRALLALAALVQAACAPAVDRPAEVARSLEGTWIAQGLAGATGAPRLVLGPAGEASGYSGCNPFASAYEHGPRDALAFGTISASKRGCRGEAMASERRVFTVLAETRSATLTRETLTLRDEDGTALLVLEREGPAR